MGGQIAAAVHTRMFHAYQVDLANKPQEFVELYHSIVPDRDVRERVPVLVHGPKRLVDHATIVVSVDSDRSGLHTSCKQQSSLKSSNHVCLARVCS